MHTLRKLAREVHRRSIWQVLGVYLVVSWTTLKAVDLVINSAGLPDWTSEMALVLLLIGLCVVATTATVQGGIPWLRMVDAGDPNEIVGLSPADVLVVPEAHPLYGVGLFTWRNAILGGVAAAALLVTSVAAYLAMWALGIGPVGSLIAQGVLELSDPIIVAEFDNRTDDAGLGGLLTDALALDLGRSNVISIIDPVRLRSALREMGREPETRLTRRIALDMAGREGVKAVVGGEVSRVRGGYQVSVGILLSDGTSLARFQELAVSNAALVPAVETLSAKIREKFGESLRTIRARGERSGDR